MWRFKTEVSDSMLPKQHRIATKENKDLALEEDYLLEWVNCQIKGGIEIVFMNEICSERFTDVLFNGQIFVRPSDRDPSFSPFVKSILGSCS